MYQSGEFNKMSQPAHQERVIQEHKTLVEMLDKLKTFINEAPEFKELPIEERGLLLDQRDAMAQYAMILTRRISIFPPEPKIIVTPLGENPVHATPATLPPSTKDAPAVKQTEATKK